MARSTSIREKDAMEGPYIRRRRPREPGYLLAEYTLKPKGITQTDFAAATGLTRKHISSVIHGRAAITPDTAVRFAEVQGTSPEYWLNLQTAVALWDARQALKDDPSIQRRRCAANGDDGPAV